MQDKLYPLFIKSKYWMDLKGKDVNLDMTPTKSEQKILNWYERSYQNGKDLIPKSFKFGSPNLVKQQIYSLFRGIYVSNDDYSVEELRKTKLFTLNGDTSWTQSFDIAKSFAFANDGKTWHPKTKPPKDYISLVLHKKNIPKRYFN
jgi:hypothetical protein